LKILHRLEKKISVSAGHRQTSEIGALAGQKIQSPLDSIPGPIPLHRFENIFPRKQRGPGGAKRHFGASAGGTAEYDICRIVSVGAVCHALSNVPNKISRETARLRVIVKPELNGLALRWIAWQANN
jgi:hypothetical protein